MKESVTVVKAAFKNDHSYGINLSKVSVNNG